MPRLCLYATVCLSLLALGVVAPAADADSASDSGVVAYVTDRDGDSEIYAVDLGDGTEENLTMHPGEDSMPKWSAFGAALAFHSDRDGFPSLYAAAVDGGEPVLISESESLDWSWSPDGRSIAWVQHRGWKDLWVTDVESGSITNLTNGTREVWGPSWSPDGRFIMFVSHDGGFFDIYRIPAHGGDAVNLSTDQTGNNLGPQWSPDGGRIAFTFVSNGSASMHVIGVDGSAPRLLYESEGAYEGCAENIESIAWSPDGSRLAFAEVTSCGGRNQFYDFHVIDAAGGTPTALGVTGQHGGPSWSPDGSRLAITTGDWNSNSIWLVDAAGTNPIDLTALVGSGQTRSAGWAPDGSRLVFEADPDPDPGAFPTPPNSDVYIVEADGSNPVELVAGTDPDWQPSPQRGVGLVDPATGLWQLEGRPAFYFGTSGDLPVLGDWSCNGVETPGLFRPSSGFAYVRNSRDTGVADISFFFGMRGDIPLAGDWDGDGCDSLGIYRPSIGKVFLRNSLDTGFADIEYFFGIPGDRPFVGDFDGDGVDELGLYRQTTGLTYMRMDHSTGIADVEFFFGVGGDHIIGGDWDRDGTDTVGVFRPSEHKFYLRNDNSTGFADHEFWMGQSQWLPVAESAE